MISGVWSHPLGGVFFAHSGTDLVTCRDVTVPLLLCFIWIIKITSVTSDMKHNIKLIKMHTVSESIFFTLNYVLLITLCIG